MIRSRRTVAFALVVVLSSCASFRTTTSSRATAAKTVPRIAIVVLENREYGQVIGNSNAPYVNRLANRWSLATRFFAVSHPSLPNYLALLGGSTFGISSDCTSCHVDAVNLVDQLERHHVTWRAYMEGMPSPCYDGASHGRYAKKHDPFMYFDSVRNDAARCANVVPFSRLQADISNDTLPSFVWVTPDLCHDGHDCAIGVADRFLHRRLPPLLQALGPGGLLVLTWDEGTTSAGCCTFAHGGHIVTILAGPAARKAFRSKAGFDSYSILRTIEDRWGFRHLHRARCSCTRSMTSLLR